MTTLLEYSNLVKTEYSPQLVIPELAKSIGLEEAIAVQQLHYWLQRCGKLVDNAIWIYNSFNEWADQFSYWSVSKIKRIFYSLEKQQIIFSKKINKSNSDHTKWYSIDYNKLYFLLKNSSNKKLKQRNSRIVSNWNNRSSQLETIINSKHDNNNHNTTLSNDKTIEEPTLQLKNRQTEALKIEEEVCKEMVEIWKKVFIHSKNELALTKNRKIKLQALWDTVFAKDIEKWRNYCIAINSSKFLMGEKKKDFKARFDWLIGEGTAQRILAGDFDIGDRVPDVEAQTLKVKAEERSKLRGQQEAELEARKLLEEEKNRVELLAEKLACEELHKLESSWGEEDKIEIRKAFEDYMGQEVIEDGFFAPFKDSFRSCGWATAAINYIFEQFKIKVCLKKKFEDFVKEAQAQLNLACNNMHQTRV